MDFTPTPTEPPEPPAAPPRRLSWWPRWPGRGGLACAFASARGLSHTVNEDCCLHYPAADAPILCAVADGVGGGAHGEVASHALAQHCAAASKADYSDPVRLAAWLRQGDRVVREAIALRGNRPGASTLVAAWFLSKAVAHVSHIGDCRAYRLRRAWRGGGLQIEQLTQDQTYGQLRRTPPPGGSPNDPACMAGVGAVGEPPVRRVRLQAGEWLLLCSDGLHKFVTDAEMAGLIEAGLRDKASLRTLCERLVEAAQHKGSHDDISALLVSRSAWFGAGLRYWLALLGVFATLAGLLV